MNQPRPLSSFLVLLIAAALPALAGAEPGAPATDEAKKFVARMEAKAGSDADRENSPAAENYRTHCAKCHEAFVYKAPARTFIQMMAPDAIYTALTRGVMRQQAAGLTAAERRGIAEYLSRESLDARERSPAPPRCTGSAARFDRAQPPELSAWGATLENTHFASGATAGLAAGDVPRLKLKWAFAFPGALRARSQPSFAMGAVFVGSQDGTVYALDAASGCVRWQFRASAEVRTPVVISAWAARDAGRVRPRAFFGDHLGRVYALDALTGKLLWRHKV
ncbi:MAG: PQQ-binding-like beta-propeller repeat protein, partial [Proteobacteria bacterium]|nr:PQQ-binding-like beta-propeller repeat protein [Pseudomonadota bacterium]